MKSIDEQINEVLRLAGVQQLDEGKFKNVGTAALAIAVVLISAKLLNMKIDVKDDLTEIYRNTDMTCGERKDFSRKSNPDLTAKDKMEYVVKCTLPKYNYSITTGFTGDREYKRDGNLKNDIYLHTKADNGRQKKIKIPAQKIKDLEDKIEDILEARLLKFAAGKDEGARRSNRFRDSDTKYHYPNEEKTATANPTNPKTDSFGSEYGSDGLPKKVIMGIPSDF